MESSRKVVFLQCEEGEEANIAKCLKGIRDCPYFFFVTPRPFAALSVEEVEQMLAKVRR